MKALDEVAWRADEAAYPVVGYGGEECVVALRAGRPVGRAEFCREVAALAERLPAHRYVLNLCTDRYRFMVGFAAALRRGQVSLLPPSDAPGVLRDLAADYPDSYALTDAPCPALPGLRYPDDLDGGADARLAPVPGEQLALVLFTSGSTGRPKPVPKSWGVLARGAQAAGTRLGITALVGGTLIGTVPHQHSYGFESIVLLGLQHGLAVDAGCYLFPADIRAALERAPRPRVLVTAPVHLRALLAEPEGLPRVDLILSATAPLPAALAARAEAGFGARLVEIYGCTEAGQIATRRTAHETEWRCLDGLALHDDGQGACASGAAVEGVARLHDAIERTGPGIFLLGERAADLVDVAGKRASLAHLNHQLLSIAGVTDGVFLMGEANGARVARLMALVVAPGLRAEAVLRALRAKIDAAFLPRPLVFVDALPRNALGKLPREALLRLARRNRS